MGILWRRLNKVGPLFIGVFFAVTLSLYAIEPDKAHGGTFDKLGDAFWYGVVTMSTVGYGDIAPVYPIARSLAGLEAVLGQLYPAIILARIMTLHSETAGRGL